jgi:hypothetical protein
MSGKILFDASPELMASLLAMPRGSRVEAIRQEVDRDCWRMRISGEGLPDQPEGTVLKVVTPTYRRVHLKAGDVVEHDVDYDVVVSWE